MSKEWFIYIVLAAAVAGTVFALRGMSEEWFGRASSVVAGTKHIMRGMNEVQEWFQEASVLAGTIQTVVEMSMEWFKV